MFGGTFPRPPLLTTIRLRISGGSGPDTDDRFRVDRRYQFTGCPVPGILQGE